MRLPSDRPVGRFLPLILAAALSACGGGHDQHLASAPAPTNGPAADYPIVVGEPYTVAGTSYTPEDKLNYDEVGYAAIDPRGGNTISGEHHTLPLPSYVEVTSLETGKTILVRLERRGPMDGNQLIGLSPGAAEQLGASAQTPVRVRRVNPPEEERALLRAGQRAAERIATPIGLVNVLRRKLPGGEGALATSTDLTAKPAPSAVPVPASTASVAPAPISTPPVPAVPTPAIPTQVAARTRPEPQTPARKASPPLPPLEPAAAQHAVVAKPAQPNFPRVATAQPKRPAAAPKAATNADKPAAPKAEPAAATPKGRYVVQAGAFSTRQRAQTVASAIGGSISKAGSLYRVRTGPFVTHKEAEASLAKVRAAGYSDARIY